MKRHLVKFLLASWIGLGACGVEDRTVQEASGGTSAGAGGSDTTAGGSGAAGVSGAATAGNGGSGEAGVGGTVSGGGSGQGGVAGQGGTSPEAGVGPGGTSSGGASGAGAASGEGGTGGSAAGSGGNGGASGGTGGMGGDGGMAGVSGSGGGAPVNIYFSEYIEGTSTNADVLEIYNAGSTAVNLGMCGVRVYSNGSTTFTEISLNGTLQPDDVLVVCSIAVAALCDVVEAELSAISGDDTIALVCNDAEFQDIFGDIGNDPGIEWGNASNGTADQTLRRMCSVSQGDRNESDSFVPASEWNPYPADTSSGLGVRSCPGDG